VGRQILFHMLPEDRTEFLEFVQERDPVVVGDFTHALKSEFEPVDLANPENGSREWLCLWNRDLLPSLRREYIAESNVGPYYRIDSSLPILEFSLPSPSVWDGKPALTQGRLYAYSYAAEPGLRGWYESLVRRMRKTFKKNPVTWMAGYVGPAAYRWYESGGLLLPYCAPPINPEWRERIYAQYR
jgi:hypothetical protein